jgi:hypothetical protein
MLCFLVLHRSDGLFHPEYDLVDKMRFILVARQQTS